MEIYLDTSKIQEIKSLLGLGVVDGVTTNPSIMVSDGQSDLELVTKQIAELVHPRHVSVEVCSTDPEEMLRQARLFASWADNIAVKITVIDENGDPTLEVIKQLEEEGIAVNCTACMSFGQAVLAAKAGATYISLLVGRINDEGNDGNAVVRMTRDWLDAWGYKSKIIAASIRNVVDIQQAAMSGAHILTIPPGLMRKMVDHKFSRATVQQFLKDGSTLLEGIGV